MMKENLNQANIDVRFLLFVVHDGELLKINQSISLSN